MNSFFLLSLFIFGTLFGSFASVLIYRLHSQESGILNGRSHCAKCNHQLGFWDLIPIFSWILNLGKCKYCKEKISIVYPLLELSTGILFALIGYFLVDYNLIINLNANEIVKLTFWLIISFISILYIFYDLLFLEIHEGIMLSGIFIATLAIIFQSFGIINIIPTLPTGTIENKISVLYSVILLVFSLIGFYIIMLKEYSDLLDTFILFLIITLIYIFKSFYPEDYTAINALVGSLIIFIFFYVQYLIGLLLHYIEKKKKKEKDYKFTDGIIGGGDFRIAILIGLLLGMKFGVPGLMITYIVGSIISIIILIIQKIKTNSQEINTQVPFGPFLAIGFFITIFYQYQINTLLQIYF